MATLLDVRSLKKRFGGLVVLEGVSFRVDQGDIFSIIGPNGAGKTTLFNILSGIYEPTEGSMWINGELINGLQMHDIARRGVGRNLPVLSNYSVLAVAVRQARAEATRSSTACECPAVSGSSTA